MQRHELRKGLCGLKSRRVLMEPIVKLKPLQPEYSLTGKPLAGACFQAV